MSAAKHCSSLFSSDQNQVVRFWLCTKSHILTYKWIVITKKIITLGSSSRFSTVKENVPESPKYNQTTGRANKGPSVKTQDTVISKNKQHRLQVRLIDDP